ncbi:MAG TPA: ABC transporter permease [Gemmatimonadaceae bacterium]|nr:ABC transporter permease [Gemmatimonadaceae bacterium]
MISLAETIRAAIRRLVRSPGFALTASLTLALGIGLSTAVFTVADALWIRRLPVRDQDRIVALWGATRDGQFANYPLSYDEARDLSRRSTTLERTAFFGYEGAFPETIQEEGGAYRLRRALVTGNFFDVLGSRAVVGRALRPEDDVAGAAPVVVLSHRAWRGRFNGDASIVGRRITMVENGRTYTVVGVMPQGLDYPNGVDIWAPLVASSSGTGDSLHLAYPALDLVARLKPGASAASARTELTNYLTRFVASVGRIELRGVVTTLPDLILGDTGPALLVVGAAAALLLLVACVNVANLLLVRALGRVRETVVRSALGASRARISGELLAESGLLAIAGGVVGLVVAIAIVRALVALAPTTLPRLDEIAINSRVFVAAVGMTIVSMLVFGVSPSVVASRVNAREVLHAGTRSSGTRGMRAATEALVAGQVALAVIVLLAAGLMTKSLVKLQRVDLGFDPQRLLVAELALRHDQSVGEETARALIDAVVQRLQSTPGIEAVSPVFTPPYAGRAGGVSSRLVAPAQSTKQRNENPMLDLEVVAPNYFAAMRIPVLAGRALSPDDREGAAPVLVVGQSVARHYWGSANPLGQRLEGAGKSFTVVGVVPETRYRELISAVPTVYIPNRQSFFPIVATTLLVRTSGEPADVVATLRRVVSDVDPRLTIATAAPFDALLDEPRAQPRLNALLLSVFAVSTLTLATIGLFAVIATMVRQRTREIGIRIALGATGASVRRMVLARGLRLAGIGAALGTLIGVLSSRYVSALLFDVSPTDLPTLVEVPCVMLAAAVLASYLPARASTRIDPMLTLRSD